MEYIILIQDSHQLVYGVMRKMSGDKVLKSQSPIFVKVSFIVSAVSKVNKKFNTIYNS